MNILIIEDNPLIALDLKEMIMSLGLESVAIARNEKEINMAIRHCSPDLCFIDFHLKHGVRGIDMVRKYRELSSAYLIYLMGDLNPTLLNEVKTTNPLSIFEKPFDDQEIMLLLQDLVSIKVTA